MAKHRTNLQYVIAVLAIAFGLTSSALAQSLPSTVPVSADVDALINQLSAEDWSTRQTAQDSLIGIGEPAKARLEQLMRESKDPEIRTRAEAALQQIEENRITGPSIVTLKFDNAPPEKVITELARQAYTTLPTQPGDLWNERQWPAISVNIQQKPFWEALREICQKVGLRIQANGDRGLVLVQITREQNMFDAPASISGPFMVMATSATETDAINFFQPQNASRNLNIQFMAFAEPKLQIANRSYLARLVEARDEKGNSLLAPGQYGESFSSDATPCWPLSATLAQPKNGGTSIARLRGTTRVILQTQSELWEIADILHAKPRTKSVNGRVYSYNEIKQTGDSYQLKLTLNMSRPMYESWDMYSAVNTLQLLDASGQPLARRGSSTTGDPQRLEYTLTFDRNGYESPTGEPAKLSWKLPVETRPLDINFSFRDLPLP